MPLVVVHGRVRGSWRRTLADSTVRVTLDLWNPVTSDEGRALEKAATRYARFLGRSPERVRLSRSGGG
jgi:hypothetical protein